VKHSQDRGMPIWRAFASVPADLLKQALETDRIKDHRNVQLESERSALYEHLRVLTREQLARRAGYDAPRQQLIASIIEQELPSA